MDEMTELAELGAQYAKLVVFADAAHKVAHELGETEIARELSLMISAAGRRIEQLTSVSGWDMLDSGE
jgi:hypothetical protein